MPSGYRPHFRPMLRTETRTVITHHCCSEQRGPPQRTQLRAPPMIGHGLVTPHSHTLHTENGERYVRSPPRVWVSAGMELCARQLPLTTAPRYVVLSACASLFNLMWHAHRTSPFRQAARVPWPHHEIGRQEISGADKAELKRALHVFNCAQRGLVSGSAAPMIMSTCSG